MATIGLKSGNWFEVEETYDQVIERLTQVLEQGFKGDTYFEFKLENFGWIDFASKVKPKLLVDLRSIEYVR